MTEQEFYEILKEIESNQYQEKKLDIHTRDFNREILDNSFILDNKKLKLLTQALQKNTYITNVDLSSNNIDNEGAKILSEELNINKLNLYGNNIEFIGFRNLLQGKFIELNLGGNNLTSNKQDKLVINSTIQIVKNNTKLIKLELEGCNLFEEDNKIISSLIRDNKSIKFLTLTLNDLNDESLEYLKDNNTLEYLSLYKNNITDMGIEHICKNNNIKNIILNDTSITDKSIKLLSEHNTIKGLAIGNCNNVTVEGLKFLIGSNIEEVHVSSNKISGEMLFYFEEAFEYVKNQKSQSAHEQGAEILQTEVIAASDVIEDKSTELIGSADGDDVV